MVLLFEGSESLAATHSVSVAIPHQSYSLQHIFPLARSMLVPAKLWSLTAIEALALIKKDVISVEDYAKALLGRIKSRDSVVKAWQYLGIPSLLSNA